MTCVWFKRDFRVTDHAALNAAATLASQQGGAVVGLIAIEPQWLHCNHFSARHYQFFYESALDLRVRLQALGIPLLVLRDDLPHGFDRLTQQFAQGGLPIRAIFAHQETGLDWTYQRDKAVADWARTSGITFTEFPQFAVKRGLKDRNQWTEFHNTFLKTQVTGVAPVYSELQSRHAQAFAGVIPQFLELPSVQDLSQQGALLRASDLDGLCTGTDSYQRGGRGQGLQVLQSFLSDRAKQYFFSVSSPTKSVQGCSRLSPYLTWGNLSLREVFAALKKKRQSLIGPEEKIWSRHLQSFESRLHWHCHFIQKLESQPEIEWQNVNRAFDGMREKNFCEHKFEAWRTGQTGYPLIDASMRALIQTGWINFRMRAMLVSFAAYQLDLHWKRPAQHLARLFVDFEPGIHFPQIQMQSGVTGINTIRIYSPEKQFYDQDPEGFFVRKYCPELRQVPLADLAYPSRMPELLQMVQGFRAGVDYPLPIVDPETSYQAARDKIFKWLNRPAVKRESYRVLERHGSRKSKHFPKQSRPTDADELD